MKSVDIWKTTKYGSRTNINCADCKTWKRRSTCLDGKKQRRLGKKFLITWGNALRGRFHQQSETQYPNWSPRFLFTTHRKEQQKAFKRLDLRRNLSPPRRGGLDPLIQGSGQITLSIIEEINGLQEMGLRYRKIWVRMWNRCFRMHSCLCRGIRGNLSRSRVEVR